MPTYRGVLGTFEGLPHARNADFAKGDVICATRYRRAPSQPSLSQRRAFSALSRRTPSIGRGHRRTPVDGGGGPNRSTEIGPWSRVRPLGVKLATFPPGNNRPAGQPLQPEPDS